MTGASSGIGQATALRLAQDGFHVLVHFHQNEAGGAETAKRIEAGGGSSALIRFDVRESAAAEQALDDYFKQVDPESRFEVLVNNAGIHSDGLAGMMSDKVFESVIESNINGPFYLMRWSVRRMIRQRSGSIVNVSSLAGQTGNPGQINYAASKAALIAMTKTLAMEVGPRGIRVNAVAPGFIDTAMVTKIPKEQVVERIPLRRFGTSEEVANVISFLCSSQSSYITGHTLSVNGGLFPS